MTLSPTRLWLQPRPWVALRHWSPKALVPKACPFNALILGQASSVPEQDVAIQRDTEKQALVLRQPLGANCRNKRALMATGEMFVLVIPPLCVCG